VATETRVSGVGASHKNHPAACRGYGVKFELAFLRVSSLPELEESIDENVDLAGEVTLKLRAEESQDEVFGEGLDSRLQESRRP